MIIDSAKYTNPGGHDVNEDSNLCLAEKGIFIVADGLGGHSDGERASRAAIDYFAENCRGGYTPGLVAELLEGANTEVLQKGGGSKTTVAAAFAENGIFTYANAGDSRVYYFRGGEMIARTKDHSVCQASVDMGLLRPEDVRGSEDRARLLKALGSEERLNLKKGYPSVRIQNGDAFLVCSDGFWEYVYESEMEADLLKSDSAEVWLKYMLKRHILRGENKGDNYTALCGIMYLDGSETFDMPKEKPFPTTMTADGRQPEKKKGGIVVPIAAAGVLLLAAAGLAVFLHGRGEEPEDNGVTSPGASTVTTTIVTSVDTSETNVSTSANEAPGGTKAESEKSSEADAPVTAESGGDKAAQQEISERV